MKKLLLALVALLSSVAYGDGPSVYTSFGKLNLLVPFSEVNVVYLYDFVGGRNLVGGETPILSAWKLELTAGAITSPQGKGSPFMGTHIEVPNPLANYAPLVGIHPGLFGGRDFNANAWVGGLKVSSSIF